MIEYDHTFVSLEQKNASTEQKSFQEMKIICSCCLFTDPLISLYIVERAYGNKKRGGFIDRWCKGRGWGKRK